VERAVAVASDHHEVRAALVSDLHDLLTGASGTNYELPLSVPAAEQPDYFLPDLGLLIVERFDQPGVGHARGHYGCGRQVPDVSNHYLRPDSRCQVRHLFEALGAGG
jgi:hypothetical protein